MTALFEIEEPEPVPFSGLLRTRCRVCRTSEALAAPDQVGNAMCGPCRQQEASAASTIQRLPAKTPPRVVWAGSVDSEPAEKLSAGPEFVCAPIDWPGGCGHVAPGPVADLAERAHGFGWEVIVKHSRGVRAGARTAADQWSVAFRRWGWQGYAVRAGEAWKSVCVTGAVLPPFLALGVTELREWLEQPERDASWYAQIRKRRAEQELAGKTRACPGPGECAWVDEGRGDHTHRANGDIKIKNSKKEQVSGL